MKKENYLCLNGQKIELTKEQLAKIRDSVVKRTKLSEKAEYGKFTIERIDTNGNYEPSNCRFADLKHQARNKTNNHRITANGENLTLVEVAEKYKINYSTLLSRINRKQDINDLILEENYG